jgi:hypothetical protein
MAASGRMVGVFQTMAIERPIPASVFDADVLIVDEGRPETGGSNLTLAAPERRNLYGSDRMVLKIVSACPFKHTVKAPPNVLNGRESTIILDGLGASVELLSNNGRWLVVAASPSGVAIQ